MKNFEAKDDPNVYARNAVQIVGIGDYGINVINKLKQDDISNVKYDIIDFKDNTIEKTREPMTWADIVLVVSNISSKSSLDAVFQISDMYDQQYNIVILLLPGSCLKNDSGLSNHALINRLSNILDTLFIISDEACSIGRSYALEEYKQIYSCVKALTDICGDRMGYINTDLGDIAGSIRNAGIGYIGFGEASGKNAIRDATEEAINCISYIKFNHATGVIATISYKDCSIEDTVPFFEKIGKKINDTVTFNYNIYSTDNTKDLCTVIILVITSE